MKIILEVELLVYLVFRYMNPTVGGGGVLCRIQANIWKITD